MKKPRPKRPRNAARMNPFILAREVARDRLQQWPDALKRVEGLLRSRDIESLANLGQPQDLEYHDPDFERLVALRQVAALFKKNEEFADGKRCQLAAQKSFERAERICRITNKRLDFYYQRPERLPAQLADRLQTMERVIARILGDHRRFLDGLPERIRLTDGATEDRGRRRSLPFLKISGKLRCTPGTGKWLTPLLKYFGVDPTTCRFTWVIRNVITLVPKNWKTHRTIAKEPTHTLPFQLAIDSFIKSRLRRWNVDLSDQYRNQELARLGSLDGSFATVDLEMASDTLALNCVAWMLPFEWYQILMDFRSALYNAPWNEQGVYAKFSSMGNGYTFALESLIFKAACVAVGSHQHAVYGDDIVIETEKVSDLSQLLAFLGFRINVAKTFTNANSRFRESCGADYYKGRRITPFYLREVPLTTHYASMAHILNGLIAVTSNSFWSFAINEARRLRLRYVPYNGDSRSGIFVDPGLAWRRGWLKICKSKDPKNPDQGFPVFDGYAPRQYTRNVRGWRSLFLWFLRKGVDRDEGLSVEMSNRNSRFLLELRKTSSDGSGGKHTATSSVATNVVYGFGLRRYFPVQTNSTPIHLWSFSDQVDRETLSTS